MALELPGYRGFGWQHPETGAVQAMLQYAGVVAPHTGQPYSEPMLLGLGGGVGCVYFVFEFSQSTWFTLFTRYAYGTATDFIEKEARRVGAKPVFSETGSRRVALANLRAALDRGRPTLAWVDQASLPYYYLPVWMRKYLAYTVVVHALDEEAGVAGIADLAATSMPVTVERLADARAAITSNKNRVMTLEPPDGPVDLAAGVRAGIHDCHTLMLAPRINNLGLPALAKWADLVANTRNQKGWPTVFPPGVKLYRGLCDTTTASRPAAPAAVPSAPCTPPSWTRRPRCWRSPACTMSPPCTVRRRGSGPPWRGRRCRTRCHCWRELAH